ncbi:MAG: histidine phosphotransferase family protein [Caulobacterales bacterium]|nr:histidine phosphotransferase family protein [Caulobacterales bacterium]
MDSKFDLESLDFVSFMSARICHDLVSPVSAIGNAIGILEDVDAQDMHEDAMALVTGSARHAWAYLEYVRLAFGPGGAVPGMIEGGEVRRLVDQMFARGRVEVVWKADAPALEKNQARLLLNLILVAAESLPRGGEVTVETQLDRMRCVAEGRKARVRPQSEAALLEAEMPPPDDPSPKPVQAYYAGAMAERMGARIAVHAADGRVEFDARLTATRPEDIVGLHETSGTNGAARNGALESSPE